MLKVAHFAFMTPSIHPINDIFFAEFTDSKLCDPPRAKNNGAPRLKTNRKINSL